MRSFTLKSVQLCIPLPYQYSKKNRPASPVFEFLLNGIRKPSESRSFVLVASLHALRLRHLAYRLVRCHALRPDDFAAEGQTRADIRIRIRSIVIRIRIRHTAIRVRIVVPAIDHTDYREAPPGTKLLI